MQSQINFEELNVLICKFILSVQSLYESNEISFHSDRKKQFEELFNLLNPLKMNEQQLITSINQEKEKNSLTDQTFFNKISQYQTCFHFSEEKNKMLENWIIQSVKEDKYLTRKAISKKAVEISDTKTFKASSSWIQRFLYERPSLAILLSQHNHQYIQQKLYHKNYLKQEEKVIKRYFQKALKESVIIKTYDIFNKMKKNKVHIQLQAFKKVLNRNFELQSRIMEHNKKIYHQIKTQ